MGNGEGNKVTETIFTGSREFITLADSREIISQIISPEPQSVSGASLNTYKFACYPLCTIPSFYYVVTAARNFARLAGGCSVAELAERCF
jgi:hypothetical protein